MPRCSARRCSPWAESARDEFLLHRMDVCRPGSRSPGSVNSRSSRNYGGSEEARESMAISGPTGDDSSRFRGARCSAGSPGPPTPGPGTTTGKNPRGRRGHRGAGLGPDPCPVDDRSGRDRRRLRRLSAHLDRGREYAGHAGPSRSTTSPRCFATIRPEAVVIATPLDRHHAMCLEALDAGCAVFCEKTMCDSIDAGPRAGRGGRTPRGASSRSASSVGRTRSTDRPRRWSRPACSAGSRRSSASGTGTTTGGGRSRSPAATPAGPHWSAG